MPRPHKEDPEILRAALLGYQHSLEVIDQRIADLRGQVGGQPAARAAGVGASGGTKRVLSPAARRRIGLAQKKRWAAYKKEHAKPAAKAPKRQISAEGRARIIAATKKRWAAFRKAQAIAKAPAKPAVKKAAPKKAPKKAAVAAAPAAVAVAAPLEG